jgi:aspartate dehydrogenase
MTVRIGLVGCGAIGTELARFVQGQMGPRARILYLCDLKEEALRRVFRLIRPRPSTLPLKELVKKSDFVIEAASVECALSLIPMALKHQKPVLLLSDGALIERPGLVRQILRKKTRFYLPSGAIAAIDGLLAARESGLKKVMLTTSKSLRSLAAAPFFERFPAKGKLRSEREIIFEGNILQAVRLFPKNLNVAALLALGGLGPRRTRVRVVAYRDLEKNIHEVEIVSRAGTITMKTENLPHAANPRTSALAVYSAQALLRKLFSPLVLGT